MNAYQLFAGAFRIPLGKSYWGVTLPITLFVFSCFFSLELRAQEQWEKEGEGEIKDVEIEIIKDRKITLPRAMRNFEKIPPRPYEPIRPAITYELKSFNFATPDYTPLIRPLKLKQEDLSRIYGNYVSGGVGNYSSFFVEGSITTRRDKNKLLGAHLFSRSFGTGPVADKNSAASTTQFQLFGKSTGKDVTLSGEAGFEYRALYFYGYNPVIEIDGSKIQQSYSIFNINAVIENTKPSDFNYSLKSGFSYLQDHYKAREGEFSVVFNSSYKIDENSSFLMQADYFLITRKDSLTTISPRHLLRLRPAYQFRPSEKLLVTAGLNLALQNDQYVDSKDFHLYPHVKAQYALGKSMEIYGVITGDMDKVNLHTMSAENPWVDSNISISNTNRAFEFRAGLSGKLGRRVSMGAGASVASLKNLYFYQNVRDIFNPAGVPVGVLFDKFAVVYDKTTQRINPFVEVSYSQADAFTMTVRGDYFNYDTDILLDAWHRPTYKMQVNGRHNFYDKITLEAGFMAQGGMKSFDPATSSVITLDPALDLNIKARYFFSKQFSAFVHLDNVLSNKYPLYQSYPVRGFQALAGISWGF